MPLKRAVIPLLDEITDTAASVEAVNTVVFTDDGRRTATTPISPACSPRCASAVSPVARAAVLGAGATASSALAALARICDGEVTAYVRSAARAAEMRQWGERLGVDGAHGRLGRRGRGAGAPLVIATTPAGATDAPRRRRTRPPRRRSSTSSTTPGRPRWPPPGRRAAARSSAASTSWSTRPCSRSSR